MSVFGLAGCLLDRHDPLRKDVKWDGHDYVGVCRHCSSPITRVARRKWRKREVNTVAKDSAAG